MAYGFQAFDDAGGILIDTENIRYGLLKSGYLDTIRDVWSKYYWRSANLDPNKESSWSAYPPYSGIAGITLVNSQSPIAFVCGDGSQVGDMVNGNERTMLFYGTTPTTKVYIFDLMRDRGQNIGMQCFNESGILTFTSEQPPLNIVSVLQPPELGPILGSNAAYPNVQHEAYAGGTVEYSANPYGSQYYGYMKAVKVVPGVTSGENAVNLSFSRSGGCYWPWDKDVDGLPGTNTLELSCNECAAGTSDGSVRFYFEASAFSLCQSKGGDRIPIWWDIPRDRAPSASVISTSQYPFPYG